jgi:hypothetical protein
MKKLSLVSSSAWDAKFKVIIIRWIKKNKKKLRIDKKKKKRKIN